MNLKQRFKLSLATGLGSGFSPKAPGTAGSLVAILLFGRFSKCAPLSPLQFWSWTGIVLLSTLLCPLLQPLAARHFGKEDPGAFVLDEWAGQWLVCLLSPFNSIYGMLAAFVTFRVFDIAKIWPASRLDRMQSPWAIVLDDLGAALQALVILHGFQMVGLSM